MKILCLCACIWLNSIGYCQLNDSIKYVIKAECLARLDKDQMKEAPEYFTKHNDSLDKIREAYFIDNFKWLISITRQYGFPTYKLLRAAGDSLQPKGFGSWQVFPSMAIIHILQTAPKMLVADDVVQLFKEEIEKGNMRRNFISDALDLYTMHSTPCKEDEAKVTNALRTWGIPTLDSNYFSDCGK